MVLRESLFTACIVIVLILGVNMIEAEEINELKVKESKVIFRAEWGNEENQLLREKGMEPDLEDIPGYFTVYKGHILLGIKQYDGSLTYSNVYIYPLNSSQLLAKKNYSFWLGKYKSLARVFGVSYLRNVNNQYVLSTYCIVNEDNKYLKWMIAKIDIENDANCEILNENLHFKKWGDRSFFYATQNGGMFINQEGHLEYYDEKGKFIGEMDDPRIFYTDKYGRIYIRESENSVGLYTIDKKKIGSFDVPAEVGTGFTINGGDADSYLYQWKYDFDAENERDHLAVSQGEYYTGIYIYHLEPGENGKRWYLGYKGYVILGKCNVTSFDGPPGKNYTIHNFIDDKSEFLQIDPDGTIYHDERDEKEFRIIKKTIEIRK